MVGRIAKIVEELKQNWGQELEDEAIRRAMKEAGQTGQSYCEARARLPLAALQTLREGKKAPRGTILRQLAVVVQAVQAGDCRPAHAR